MPESPYKHLAHLSPFASEAFVFFTVVAARRRSVFAHADVHEILRGVWERSAERNGWWVGDYLLMPDHVRFFYAGLAYRGRHEKVGTDVEVC